jgi:hemolysin D
MTWFGLNVRWRATAGLLQRYAEILQLAWRQREPSGGPRRLPHELAFLPANLELTETPVHPVPRWTMRLLVFVVILACLLAMFGRLDIVAIAPGRLIPNASVKVIQPAVTGVIRKISVQNGQRVRRDQLLVELDPTQAAADAEKARVNDLDAQLSRARARALLAAEEHTAEPQLSDVEGASQERQSQARSLAAGAYHEFRDKLASLKAELTKREAELLTTRQEITKLEQTAPLARSEANDYEELARGNYVAAHEYLDKKKSAIELTEELAAQKSHARELEAGIEEQRHDVDSAIATFRREQWDALNKAEQDLLQSQADESKATARQGLMRLTAPVDGVVQQLNVHTVGGVVTSAETLMEIVPDDTLEVEANISNRDIGFVNPGQSAVVKITTFPYTRYGYLTGRVTKVSNDATQDKKLGLIFPARIWIPRNQFKVGNKWVTLSPGMEVTAEVKTGTQRVWQYFLSPLIETGREGLRER